MQRWVQQLVLNDITDGQTAKTSIIVRYQKKKFKIQNKILINRSKALVRAKQSCETHLLK
jgi:hypothetical protein